jgi:hypothetical protein
MKNLLILFNPYYQNDVIEQHLKILKEKKQVAFGKVRSKLKTIEHSFEDQLQTIYDSIDEQNYLQLFLTDYSSIFVAKVVKVSSDDLSKIAPSYYKEKNLDVEQWFVISDMREIVNDNFTTVRDDILSNFTVPNYNNHSYAIYGNSYIYPIIVNMKEEVDYFKVEDEDYRYYTNMFKSQNYISIKENLAKYTFGNIYTNQLHPNSMDNIISAEIEYEENINDPLYDFSSVVVKYAKTMEQEIYLFAKALFKYLIKKDSNLVYINYSVQGKDYILEDILTYKPNLGTYKFLIKNSSISACIDKYLEYQMKYFVTKKFTYYIKMLQAIRNETVHGNAPKPNEVKVLRAEIIGVANESMLIELVKHRVEFKYSKTKLESMK